jgi:hypothetical protein
MRAALEGCPLFDSLGPNQAGIGQNLQKLLLVGRRSWSWSAPVYTAVWRITYQMVGDYHAIGPRTDS